MAINLTRESISGGKLQVFFLIYCQMMYSNSLLLYLEIKYFGKVLKYVSFPHISTSLTCMQVAVKKTEEQDKRKAINSGLQ